MSAALHQLILDVNDLGESLRFYVDLLHLFVRDESMVDGVRLVSLRTGGTDVLLVQRTFSYGILPEFTGGGVVLNFDVANLAQLLPELQNLGIGVLRGIESSPNGEASLLVADPDGYAVLLSERPRMLN